MTTVDIVGGGIGGLVLARSLLQRGLQVRVWERARSLGGLMGRTHIAELGVEVDRYYHAILSSDATLMQLIDELGLRGSLHMRATRMGFYHGGRTYPMSTPLEFLRFPPLSMIDRARLAYTILAARRVRDWRALEQVPVLDWLRELSGERVVETIWKPLLRAKFDGGFEQVPATYIWSRLVRTTSSHGKGGTRELMCFLEGGYMQLIEALAADITRRGGTINLGAKVEQVQFQGGRAAGVIVDGQPINGDGVALTIQTPAARTLLPARLAGQSERWGRLGEYLGIVCVMAVLRRRVTPYYTLNITDERVPFTGVIETTNLIDPAYTGGYHLVYLPKYVSAGSPYARMGEEELAQSFTARLLQMFPDLSAGDIAAVRVGRERLVEPLHPVGRTDDIPPIVGDVPGLFLANAAQIYPQLTNGESVVAHAGLAAEAIVSALHQGEARWPARPLVSAPAA